MYKKTCPGLIEHGWKDSVCLMHMLLGTLFQISAVGRFMELNHPYGKPHYHGSRSERPWRCLSQTDGQNSVGLVTILLALSWLRLSRQSMVSIK